MNRMLSSPKQVVIDVEFELLAVGVEQTIDQAFGLTVTRLSEPALVAGGDDPQSTSVVLIADFGGAIHNVEQRIAHLLLRAQRFKLLVLMLVQWDDVAIRLIRAGAKGVLYPGGAKTDLVEAIYTVSARQTYLPPTLQTTLAQRYVAGAEACLDGLTRREVQVVRSLAMGATTGEIACELNIGVKTAETHRANILRKLGVRNNVELARLALRNGLAPL